MTGLEVTGLEVTGCGGKSFRKPWVFAMSCGLSYVVIVWFGLKMAEKASETPVLMVCAVSYEHHVV